MPTPRRHTSARDHLELLADGPGASAYARVEQAQLGGTKNGPRGAAEPTSADDALDQVTVERAIGMLTEYYDRPARTAALVLQRWTQEAGLPPTELAAGLVAVGSQPGLHPVATLPRALRTYALDVDAEP